MRDEGGGRGCGGQKEAVGAGGAKFFADSMLGSLARWLRTLGCDVEYEKAIDDSGLVARAVRENRMVLTRDTILARRRLLKGRVYLVEGGTVEEQLKKVAGAFGVTSGGFLTRCIRCNELLNDVEKKFVKDRVPPYVFETQETFSFCARCGRVYWAGTHRENMVKEIERMLEGK